MAGQITVVGSSNIDFIMQVARLPLPGETVTDGKFTQAFGGKGANQATAASRSGGEVVFIASVGEDTYGKAMKKNLRADGIETRTLQFHPHIPTGSALILVDAAGENSIAVSPGANHAFSLDHLEACAEVLRGSSLILLQMEIPASILERTFEIAYKADVPVMLNYAPIKDKAIELSEKIAYLVVNEIEASELTGLSVKTEAEARKAAQALRTKGIETIIVTLGASGSLLLTSELEVLIPAFPVTPVDTTAAGDTFCGALATALTEEKPLSEAVRFASAAAALSVTRMGAQPSIPLRPEIETKLKTSLLS